MHESDSPRPAVTVAAVVVEGDRYLVVEEVTRAGLRLNQPAGHLESGEAIAAAAAREALEETGYRVRPTALVGIYRWESPDTGITFIRFAFAADILAHEPERPLDEGIVRALWLSYAEIVAQRERHRSPLVLRCLDDFRAGRRLPLDVVGDIG